jgi:predicted RNA-binding Zn-ribbon protein involved in translation (DUF1610 family)
MNVRTVGTRSKAVVMMMQISTKMPCPKCGEKSPDDYRPLTTKYPEGFQI